MAKLLVIHRIGRAGLQISNQNFQESGKVFSPELEETMLSICQPLCISGDVLLFSNDLALIAERKGSTLH